MKSNMKSGTVKVEDSDIEYISFGKGSQVLIMLPGLGDGLKTVKGGALPFFIAYRSFSEKYRVYAFSRKNHMEMGYSTRDMAKDQAKAMEILGIDAAYVMGISQGGMIAQHLAIDYPHLVERLVLAVTASRPNKTIQTVIKFWIDMAERGDYKSLIIDTAEKLYSEKYLRKLRLVYPILGRVGKPKDFTRFIVQAHSCLQHNAHCELPKITCPTLVVGGSEDKIVGPAASYEIADQIGNSILFIYPDLGHGLYEEAASDYNGRVMDFLSTSVTY